MRRILHIDMDAFFASVEQRDHPEWRGKPVIVAGASDTRGVVTTASYEARAFGVHSAMPVMRAKRLCPAGIYVPVRKDAYRQESKVIMGLLSKVTPTMEILSVDEAFLDVTDQTADMAAAIRLAKAIQYRIYTLRGLTCSVGVSYQKFAAKLASDFNKPAGLTVISQENFKDQVWPLPVGRMMGVGPHTQALLEGEGIYTIEDLAKSNVDSLARLLGKRASDIYDRANGIDPRPVVTVREAKSIGRERTFSVDIADKEALKKILADLVQDVSKRLRREGLLAKTVTLKWRLSNFTTHTKQVQLPWPVNGFKPLWQATNALLEDCYTGAPLRLIGMTASQLSGENDPDVQLALFNESGDLDDLDRLIERLQVKYGKDSMMRAIQLPKKGDHRPR
ncbi:DNA polymerase IV [Peptococcus simiae]|uniref:DNA polymerase IV n=1 Tax=Peptococcus simiae TaxID=1643805 RepID=UPI00398025B4